MLKQTLFGAVTLCLTASAAQAGGDIQSLESLERERALTVQTFIDPALEPNTRAQKLETATRRLIDLERMVIRDDKLTGSASPVVRVAFSNYDLTFLVHASVERNVTLIDQWMDQVGVTTDSLMTARAGRRYQ